MLVHIPDVLIFSLSVVQLVVVFYDDVLPGECRRAFVGLALVPQLHVLLRGVHRERGEQHRFVAQLKQETSKLQEMIE